MKKFGDRCIFRERRNRELLKRFRECLTDVNLTDYDDIVRAVINSPCSRFWVSPERAAIVVGILTKGGSIDYMSESKLEMFTEIYRRVCELRSVDPRLNISNAVAQVVYSPAPKFYLKLSSARIMLVQIRNEWLKRRRQSMLHS